jgi:hypothetical protein
MFFKASLEAGRIGFGDIYHWRLLDGYSRLIEGFDIRVAPGRATSDRLASGSFAFRNDTTRPSSNTHGRAYFAL